MGVLASVCFVFQGIDSSVLQSSLRLIFSLWGSCVCCGQRTQCDGCRFGFWMAPAHRGMAHQSGHGREYWVASICFTCRQWASKILSVAIELFSVGLTEGQYWVPWCNDVVGLGCTFEGERVASETMASTKVKQHGANAISCVRLDNCHDMTVTHSPSLFAQCMPRRGQRAMSHWYIPAKAHHPGIQTLEPTNRPFLQSNHTPRLVFPILSTTPDHPSRPS
jgi:hypothetical protein